MMFRNTITACLCSVVVVGCASQNKPTMKQEAIQQWNTTRCSMLLTLAKDQLQSGNYDKSRQTVDEALKLDPKNVQALILSGRLAIERGQMEQAERQLLAARTMDATNSECDYFLGVVYQRWQQPTRAVEMYRSAMEKAPGDPGPVLATAELLVPTAGIEPAILLLRQKTSSFPHNPSIHDMLGQLLQQHGQTDEAIQMFRKAAELDPEDSTLREHLAMAMFEGRQYRASADLLDRLVRAESHSRRTDLMVALGHCRLSLQEVKPAREAFERATEIDTASSPAWLGAARAALMAGELSRAERAARKALSLDSRNASAELLLGYIQVEQRKFSDARERFARAVAMNPGDPTAICMVGYTDEQLGNRMAARQQYRKALAINPNDELATKLLARVEQD